MRNLKSVGLVILPILVVLSTGCVRKGTYESVVDELARARADHESATLSESAARAEEKAALERTLADVRAELRSTRSDLAAAELEIADLRRRLDNEVRSRARTEGRLQETGEEANRLRSRLAALSAVEAEIRSRNQIYEDMIGRFRSLIDAGQLSISIVDGRMVLHLPQDVLFQSGSASLNRDGTAALTQIGQVLGQITDRRFQVEGHTDNVPISTARFPSNWELSSGRALAVVRVLLDQGVSPDNVSGAAYGEHHPVAGNETPEGRRRNRRIEIVMLPNLNVIADLGIG